MTQTSALVQEKKTLKDIPSPQIRLHGNCPKTESAELFVTHWGKSLHDTPVWQFLLRFSTQMDACQVNAPILTPVDFTCNYFAFFSGGIMAGVVSDQSGKRATTCGVMLVLAAPMVRCEQDLTLLWMREMLSYFLGRNLLRLTQLLKSSPWIARSLPAFEQTRELGIFLVARKSNRVKRCLTVSCFCFQLFVYETFGSKNLSTSIGELFAAPYVTVKKAQSQKSQNNQKSDVNVTLAELMESSELRILCENISRGLLLQGLLQENNLPSCIRHGKTRKKALGTGENCWQPNNLLCVLLRRRNLVFSGLLMATGALVNGPYALITTAVSADLGTHKSLRGNARALATVTAIIDGTGSIGKVPNSHHNAFVWFLGDAAKCRAALMSCVVNVDDPPPHQSRQCSPPITPN